MNLTNFRFETDSDGIATATWDMPGRSKNVITAEVMQELHQVIDAVVADGAIKGCVITSGKDSFSGGADLTMLQASAGEYAKLLKSAGEEAETHRHGGGEADQAGHEHRATSDQVAQAAADQQQ